MKQAMIFAAGLGTRLRPLTDTMPKALVPVGGRPLLHHVIERLKAAGFERIVINVHHLAEQIVADVEANNSFGLDVHISDERSLLLETGGGLRKAASLFDPSSPILIHNVDILSNANLSAFYDSLPIDAAAALLVSERKSTRQLQFSPADNRLVGWQNLKTGEVRGQRSSKARAFSGIHLFSPTLLPLMQEWPERFSIIDFYLHICNSHTILGVEQAGLQLLDVGKIDTLADAEQFLANNS